MAKSDPYFFKISTDPKDPWYSLGCYHSVEEAFEVKKETEEHIRRFLDGRV